MQQLAFNIFKDKHRPCLGRSEGRTQTTIICKYPSNAVIKMIPCFVHVIHVWIKFETHMVRPLAGVKSRQRKTCGRGEREEGGREGDGCDFLETCCALTIFSPQWDWGFYPSFSLHFDFLHQSSPVRSVSHEGRVCPLWGEVSLKCRWTMCYHRD